MSKTKKQSETWFEVVAHSDAMAKKVVEIPDGQRYTLRGPIHEMMIMTIPQQQLKTMIENGSFDSTMNAISTAVRGGGFDGGLLITPEGLQYMKLQPVDRITSKLLEQRDQRQKDEYQVKINKIKNEQENGVRTDIFEQPEHPVGNVEELRSDTKTVGEA